MQLMKPIIFGAPMVQAINENRKTQTRRVMKPANPFKSNAMGGYRQGDGLWIDGYNATDEPNGHIKDYSVSSCWFEKGVYIKKYAPRHPGDILWVRETFLRYKDTFYYKADNKHLELEELGIKFKWKPSIHMPREAARIFLRVTDVRVERVQSISPEDAVSEGAVRKPHNMRYGGEDCLVLHGRYIKDFQALWDNLNAKRGYGWETNPWVWVYEFEKTEAPHED